MLTAPKPFEETDEAGMAEVGAEEYKYKKFQLKDLFTKPKYIPWWILGIAVTVISVLLTVHHDQVIEALKPISLKIRELPAGFLIPVAILIAISFPPLFGHEFIALLCGAVYGLWPGFAIVAAGTFFGEIGTWFAFKYAFRNKAAKMERTDLNYGALARVTRDGGFLVVLIIRFSIIPSHFSTAVFSTYNVRFWHFVIATFLTLPKQLVIVYVGALLVQESKDNRVNEIVPAITFLTTIVAGAYIYIKMRKTKKLLLQEQEARLDAKRSFSRDFSPDVNIEVTENFWRQDRSGRSGNLIKPPSPTWQEGSYEMDGTGKQRMRMQEFI